MRFFVDGSAESDDVLRQKAQYVLFSDRRLHVALGTGVTARYYPKLTRLVSPNEFDALVRYVLDHQLLSEPTSPAAEVLLASPDAAELTYHVAIFARGRRYEYVTTPAESPPTVGLLARLTALRADRPG